MARLVLVGLPGTGKSSVGQEVARKLDVAFLDTDDLIASAVGGAPGEYLRTNGEEAFRDREYEALVDALRADAVVATGGGVVSVAGSRDLLANEVTFWLDCGDEELVRRVVGGDRPLLGDDPLGAIARLRTQREAWYRAVSRARVDSSGTLDNVVAQVLDEARKAER